jgi:xanthine dehydrogenase small subunit
LNDQWVELEGTAPTTTLLRYLRDAAHLTGTKEGCAEGDCGACTVAVIERDGAGQPVYRGVNACLVLLPMVQGKQVYTVEALKDPSGAPHPVQETLARAMGSQCGYCTPGVVMAMFEACYRTDLDAPWKHDAALCGNLCRCTGYRPIREATHAVAGLRPTDRFTRALHEAPPADMHLAYATKTQAFFTPTSLDELWEVMAAHPAARFVMGGTDLSLEITKRFAEPEQLISLEGLPLRGITEVDGGWRVGATTCLTELEDFAESKLVPVARMLRYFGARQIKNRATVGGNLCTASPIGDLAPVLLALGATAVLASKAGERKVPLDQFFLSYRKTALSPGEILAAVEVPRPGADARVAAYKVSKRRELDISAVSAGFLVRTDAAGLVTEARLAYGGMAAVPARARKAEAALVGQPWTQEAVRAASLLIAQDLSPLSDHRGSATYRSLVARNLLRGFFDETRAEPQPKLPHPHTATVQA